MAIEKFVKEHQISSYECDKHGYLKLPALMNLLQDAADGSADKLGLGYDFCRKNGLAWVAASYHAKIIRCPKNHEKIILTTWPSEEKKLTAIRDYEIKDAEGNVIVRASTQWALINFANKRPVALRDNLPFYEVIAEKADDFEFTRLPLPERHDISKEFSARFDDIDLNNHVNNAVYLLWASETADAAFRNNHRVCEFEVSFKKGAVAGDVINSVAFFEGLHSINSQTKTDGTELTRISLSWEAA